MIVIACVMLLALGIIAGIGGERTWQARERAKQSAVQKVQKKLDDAEMLIIQLHAEAQDKQMRRLDPPKLETGILIPIIFHRERIEHPEWEMGQRTYSYTYTPWKVVADYGRKRKSDFLNLYSSGDYRRVTDEYKAHTLRVKWNQIPQPTEYTVTLPDQNPVAIIEQSPKPEPIKAEVVPTTNVGYNDPTSAYLEQAMKEYRNSPAYQSSKALFDMLRSSYR